MLSREKESYNELAKERDILSLNVSQLQVNSSEETKELKKSRQEFEDELKKRTEELTECKEKLHAHDQAAKRAIAALQKEMELRIDQVSEENALAVNTDKNLAHQVDESILHTLYLFLTKLNTLSLHVTAIVTHVSNQSDFL